MKTKTTPGYQSTQNPCKLCTPFGACMAFTGIAEGMPFIHGSQGCSTYIRRYLIGHFREPVDIGCSNFSESTVIFGGEENFRIGLENIVEQYQPKLIGIATTCLAETIGDDLSQFVQRFEAENPNGPVLVPVSTPSYQGSHIEGFHRSVRAIVEKLALSESQGEHINLFSGMVSPEDIRHMREVFEDFNLSVTILPDYSDSLDGGIWHHYEKNIETGTLLEDIRRTGSARATIEFGHTRNSASSAGDFLLRQFGTPFYQLPLPIGVQSSDTFFERLQSLSDCKRPGKYSGQRSRLVDSYVDGHKYVFGKKAVLYGPQDQIVSVAGFLNEIGMIPVLCGTGEKTGLLESALQESLGGNFKKTTVIEDTDFVSLEEAAATMDVDMVIGNSNGCKIARKLGVPLVRMGLPIHDRLGAARILTLGYKGTQELFDRIVNEFIRVKQENSPVGYTHI
ncbi:MAG: nitrogenase component 1 [Planctomycetota bacterium]